VNLNPAVAETLFGEDLYQIPGRILIVIQKEWSDITPDEKNQLVKILAAVKLNIEAVQIISLETASIKKLSPFAPTRIISFGVPFQPEVKAYENTQIENINVISADSLSALDDVKKRNLWLALKAMFGV